MNTKKILIVSSDKDIIEIIKMTALTLTKLNCQVSIEDVSVYKSAVEISKTGNLDMIIIDNDMNSINTLDLILEIRSDMNSKNKKIITLYTDQLNREEVFKAGCDSIMSKEEFNRVVNNILVF